jgi:RHS repeat-associated protein
MTARFQRAPSGQSPLNIITGYYRYGETVGGIKRGPRQLTSITHRDCPLPGEQSTFDYDKAGRQTRENQKTLDYDGFDQLIAVTLPGIGTQTHTYGFDGHRTSTTLGPKTQTWFSAGHTLAAGVRTHYVTVGDRLVATLNFDNSTVAAPQPPAGPMSLQFVSDGAVYVAEHASGLVSTGLAATSLLLLCFAIRRGSRPIWQTAPAVVVLGVFTWLSTGCSTVDKQVRGAERSTERKYFHQGLSVGPVLITSPGKAVLEERRFEPFGQPIQPTALVVNPYNNLNKETDPDTGWSYHGARWMEPQTARWTSPDPPVKAPDGRFLSEPWSLHPYQYALQNPTLYWDPDGADWTRQDFFSAVETLHGMGISNPRASQIADQMAAADPDRPEAQFYFKQRAAADFWVKAPWEALSFIDGAVLVTKLPKLITTLGTQSKAGFKWASRAVTEKFWKFRSWLAREGSDHLFKPNELPLVHYLRGLGKKVYKNVREGLHGAGKQGDAYVDGVKTELKVMDAATSTAIVRRVSKSLGGTGQARQIWIDARAAGTDLATAADALRRITGIAKGRLDRVAILGRDYHIGVIYK